MANFTALHGMKLCNLTSSTSTVLVIQFILDINIEHSSLPKIIQGSIQTRELRKWESARSSKIYTKWKAAVRI